jgi:outer membrane protein assembly factor BamC
MAGDKVDYRRSSTKTAGLDVPPDLTQLARENRASGGGTVSASSMTTASAASNAVAAAAAVAATPDPTGRASLRIERLADQRWLVTSISPEMVWPQLKEFWQERGFNLESERSALGLMETDWAENRAKLPQDIIRRTVGKLIDGLYSTGERDQFRTRIERTATGGSEIYISHRGMVEVYNSSKAENTVWQPRPTDPQLEAIFLQRLMMKLGATEEQSKAAVLDAQAPATRTRVIEEQGQVTLQINDTFDRAWRMVGLSLDRTGFTVEDRDRSKGLYFVRYVDPKEINKDQPGFLSRLFSKEKGSGPDVDKYRIAVKAEGERSTASVLNAEGQAATEPIAKRILELLAQDLK